MRIFDRTGLMLAEIPLKTLDAADEALKRLARALTMQFKKENKRIIGVNISSIGFYFTLQSKEETNEKYYK